jgi:hypothetical protein
MKKYKENNHTGERNKKREGKQRKTLCIAS